MKLPKNLKRITSVPGRVTIVATVTCARCGIYDEYDGRPEWVANVVQEMINRGWTLVPAKKIFSKKRGEHWICGWCLRFINNNPGKGHVILRITEKAGHGHR